mmetsp:Transcript_110515/g.276731  ORF Transcript_110515/g.276731 Transcript_110515/m.276731 type:complete len:433 (-) Transcript_110515:108-1406(-)
MASASCLPRTLLDGSKVAFDLAGIVVVSLVLVRVCDALHSTGLVVALTLACIGFCTHFAPRGVHEQCKATLPNFEKAWEDRSQEADDLAERRANRYGLWKYCGLRPDPFAADTPPSYVYEGDPGLRLPALRMGEREKLSALRVRLGDLAAVRARVDDATLLRYLRARGSSVNEAERMFREWVAFRSKTNLDSLEKWNLDAYERCLASWWVPCGLLRHGLNGEPVQYERLGATDLRRLVDGLGLEMLKKTDLVHCMRMHAALEEDALRRGVPLSGCIVVFDLAGLGRDQISLSMASTLVKLVEARDLLLPELVDRILIVNASPVFARAWNMFSYFLPPATRTKVQMASAAGTKDLLLENIASENLPGFLGGELCIDGDPECRRIIAPGGSVPEEVLLEFKALVKTGHVVKQGYRKPSEPRSSGCFACCFGRAA